VPAEPFRFLSDSEFRTLPMAEKDKYLFALRKHLDEEQLKARAESTKPPPPEPEN
jgi:hypothetical protein